MSAQNKTTDVYFDFEFIDDGKEIIPISLGMCTAEDRFGCTEDGYSENNLYVEYSFDPARCSDWVRENVFPYLEEDPGTAPGRHHATQEILDWVDLNLRTDTTPRFIGYYPSYDWVCLTQHFGTMMQLPKSWPTHPVCLAQMAEMVGFGKDQDLCPDKPKNQHNALADAMWIRDLHKAMELHVEHERRRIPGWNL